MDRPGEQLRVHAAIARFDELFATSESSQPTLPLDEAALAISAVLQPDLDVAAQLAALDALAQGCHERTREGVVAHLFGELGFGGGGANMGDWRHSCLDHVIAARRGIPISLAVVTVEVARRVGVRLCGVSMPAHFLVGDPDDPEWFVDAYSGGVVRGRDGCHELLERVTGGQLQWRESFLDPTSERAIIVRMLNNLRAGFTQKPDPLRLALVMRMRMSIPELDGERRNASRALGVLN